MTIEHERNMNGCTDGFEDILSHKYCILEHVFCGSTMVRVASNYHRLTLGPVRVARFDNRNFTACKRSQTERFRTLRFEYGWARFAKRAINRALVPGPEASKFC